MKKRIRVDDWSGFIKKTRERLELDRKHFAVLFGVSIETLNNWEYRGQIPPPMCQDALITLYENSDRAKAIVGRESFWKEVAKGAFVVGVILLLCKMFSDSGKNQ